MPSADDVLWPLAPSGDRTRWAAQAAELYVHLGCWSSRSPRLAPPPSPLLAHSQAPENRRNGAITGRGIRLIGLHAGGACMPSWGWLVAGGWIQEGRAVQFGCRKGAPDGQYLGSRSRQGPCRPDLVPPDQLLERVMKPGRVQVGQKRRRGSSGPRRPAAEVTKETLSDHKGARQAETGPEAS